MRRIALLLVLVAACSTTSAPGDDTSASPDAGATSPDGAPGSPDGAPNGACAAGSAGVACVLDLYDRVSQTCDPGDLAALVADLEARRGTWPLWSGGRALFVTDAPSQVAGAFNNWASDADATVPLCTSNLSAAIVSVPTGRWPYKLVVAGTWELDPGNWGFAFDDYTGNADGKNSVIDTYDSGLGHLVMPPTQVCSTALGNCRSLTTYLPPGYDDPANAARVYPVVFMHDGQNIYDNHTCCFGHTGWEVNVTLDSEIAAGHDEPTIIVGADHGGVARNDEYGFSTTVGGKQETFMDFQVHTIQPTAAGYWRLDPARTYVAGSSLGGLVSMRLALAYPSVYQGAASLSGAFWPGMDTNTALRDYLTATGKVPVPIYLDHGGDPTDNSDGAADSDQIRDMMVADGWVRADSPACTSGHPDANALCTYWEPGATHDELAWKARAWRFLRFFVGTGQ